MKQLLFFRLGDIGEGDQVFGATGGASGFNPLRIKKSAKCGIEFVKCNAVY
jgi:hypothetical protein